VPEEKRQNQKDRNEPQKCGQAAESGQTVKCGRGEYSASVIPISDRKFKAKAKTGSDIGI